MTGRVRASSEVTVIIPLYNGEATILDQLQALGNQSYSGSWDLLVVDNGSADGGPERVREWIGRHGLGRLVTAKQPGAPAARNEGARLAQGRWLAFCDDDDVVGPGWLAALMAARAPGVQLAGVVDLEALGGGGAWRAEGSARRAPDAAGHPIAEGANCAIERELFLSIGGFSTERALRAGYDVDLSWRLLRAGHEVRFVPDALVHRRPKATLWGHGRQWLEYGRSSAALYQRHPQFAPSAWSPELRRQRRAALSRDVAQALSRPWSRRRSLVQMAAYQAGRVLGPPKAWSSPRHYR